MAIPAFVQSTTGSASLSTTTATTAFSSPPTASNAICAIVGGSISQDIKSVTDNAGNLYVKLFTIPFPATTTTDLSVWLATNIATTASFVVTGRDTNTSVGGVIAMEISGLATTGVVLDAYGTAGGHNNSVAAPSISTTLPTVNTNDIVIAAFTENVTGSVSYVVGAGYSNLINVGGGGFANVLVCESQVVSSAGIQTATVSGQTASKDFNSVVFALSGSPVNRGDTLYNHVQVGNGMSRSEVAN